MMKPTATNPEAVEPTSGSKPNASDDVKARRTGALRTFAPNVWIADGPNIRDFGVLFTTRLVVVKLAHGSLTIIIAHGPCVEHDAKPFVERAFRWLTR